MAEIPLKPPFAKRRELRREDEIPCKAAASAERDSDLARYVVQNRGPLPNRTVWDEETRCSILLTQDDEIPLFKDDDDLSARIHAEASGER